MSTDLTVNGTDVDVVAAGFGSLAQGDLAGFGAMFADDATWNHHNDDRFGGVKSGRDAIVGYIGDSAQLTAGTLRPVPRSMSGDGRGTVCVVVDLSATRPDGRTLADGQVLVLSVEGGYVQTVDQYIGDPSAVAAFWA